MRMLYLIHPDMTTKWVDFFGRKEIELAVEKGLNLDAFDWQPAERIADEGTIRLALRHGEPSAYGIVVAATDLVPYDHPKRIRETHAEVLAHRPTYRLELAKLEQVMPGTLAAEDASVAAVDASIARSLAEADAEFEEALAAAPKAALLEHWRALGGFVPEPL
jgi:hypothetical protein